MSYIPTPATFEKLGFYPTENPHPSAQPIWYHNDLARGFSAAKRLILLNGKTGFVQLLRIDERFMLRKVIEKELNSEKDLIDLVKDAAW